MVRVSYFNIPHMIAHSVLLNTLTHKRIWHPAFDRHERAVGVQNKGLERRTSRYPSFVGGT
jgi:hypothetical protein